MDSPSTSTFLSIQSILHQILESQKICHHTLSACVTTASTLNATLASMGSINHKHPPPPTYIVMKQPQDFFYPLDFHHPTAALHTLTTFTNSSPWFSHSFVSHPSSSVYHPFIQQPPQTPPCLQPTQYPQAPSYDLQQEERTELKSFHYHSPYFSHSPSPSTLIHQSIAPSFPTPNSSSIHKIQNQGNGPNILSGSDEEEEPESVSQVDSAVIEVFTDPFAMAEMFFAVPRTPPKMEVPNHIPAPRLSPLNPPEMGTSAKRNGSTTVAALSFTRRLLAIPPPEQRDPTPLPSPPPKPLDSSFPTLPPPLYPRAPQPFPPSARTRSGLSTSVTVAFSSLTPAAPSCTVSPLRLRHRVRLHQRPPPSTTSSGPPPSPSTSVNNVTSP